MIGAIVIFIAIIYTCCKRASTNSYMKNSAKKTGSRFYVADDGTIRDINTDRQVILDGNGKLIDVKTGVKY